MFKAEDKEGHLYIDYIVPTFDNAFYGPDKPSLITIPTNQTALEGTLATFRCRADGNPTPRITWKKDGKTAAQGETLSFEADRTQSGEYLCSAENGLNSTVSASAHLNVQCEKLV